MELLSLNHLTFHTGTKPLFEDLNLTLQPGDRLGLIGPNGSGKTTLVRLILGTETPEKGRILTHPGLKIGYIPQTLVFPEEMPLGDYLLEPLAPLQRKLDLLQEQLSVAREKETEPLLCEYQQTLDLFEAAGGYTASETAEKLIRSLGLDNPLDQPIKTLSGGEKSLLAFGRAVMGNPHLLVLDEPGNHLDFLGLAWLETFLGGWKQAVLTVSHNRYYLDRVCTRILELESGRHSLFTGNFSAWRLEKGRRDLIDQSLYLAGQKEAAELEKRIKELRSIASSQYNPPASVLAQLGAAKGKLARLKERLPEQPRGSAPAPGIRFVHDPNRSDLALRISGLTLTVPEGHGYRELIRKASAEIRSGEKVALLGPNGSGKTTLIKAILAADGQSPGPVTVGPSQRIGLLSQTPEWNPQAVSVEDEVRSWGPITRDEAFHLISRFLFAWSDLEKPLGVLSGGEANRLQLARLLYLKADFLILDEPTNHLDIPAQEAVEEALAAYEGTLLIVSHDRYLLDRIAERIIEIRDGNLVSHPCRFSEYFSREWPVLPRLSGSLGRRGREKSRAGGESRSGKVPDDAIKRLEARIVEAETERSRLEREIREAFRTNDSIRGRQLSVKLEKCGTLLERLYREWEASA